MFEMFKWSIEKINRFSRSMDLSSVLEEKLAVGGVKKSKEKTRKKKEKFAEQVKVGLEKIINDWTLQYEPGRKYRKYKKYLKAGTEEVIEVTAEVVEETEKAAGAVEQAADVVETPTSSTTPSASDLVLAAVRRALMGGQQSGSRQSGDQQSRKKPKKKSTRKM